MLIALSGHNVFENIYSNSKSTTDLDILEKHDGTSASGYTANSDRVTKYMMQAVHNVEQNQEG